MPASLRICIIFLFFLAAGSLCPRSSPTIRSPAQADSSTVASWPAYSRRWILESRKAAMWTRICAHPYCRKPFGRQETPQNGSSSDEISTLKAEFFKGNYLLPGSAWSPMQIRILHVRRSTALIEHNEFIIPHLTIIPVVVNFYW